MADILDTLSDKLMTPDRQQSFISEYSLLKTDTDRVKYTMQLLVDHSIPIDPLITPKSSFASKAFRDEGNRLFSMPYSKSKLDESIEQYTKSIISAPSNSEELSLAYADRSAALFKARLYKDCLLDISRALALPYPDNLRANLYVQQARCLLTSKVSSMAQKIKLGKSLDNARFWLDKMDPTNPARSLIEKTLKDPEKMTPVEKPFVKWNAEKNLPQLDGKENGEIPQVSDSLELKYSDKFGKHMVATRDIYPGEVLGVMTPYASVLVPEKLLTHCWGCQQQTWSSVPCDYCVNVVYCNEFCRDKAWRQHHDVECVIIGSLLSQEMSYVALLSMRLVVRAVKEAGGVGNLREKVKELEGKVGRTNGFTGGILDAKDYASVYTLTRNMECWSIEELFVHSLNATYIIFMLATRSEMFGQKLKEDLQAIMRNEDVIFIGGLCMRHQQIIPMSGHFIAEVGQGIKFMEKSVAIMPVYSLINHSCDPAINRCTYGKSTVLHAVSIIRKGDQIFDNYGPHYSTMPKSERQAKLMAQFGFTCECQPCIENWPTCEELDLSVTGQNITIKKLRENNVRLKNITRQQYYGKKYYGTKYY